MSTRTLFLSAGLLVFCGVALSQPPTTPPSPPPPLPSVPPVAEKSVDQLLNELERVQAEKAALEKKEQELKVTIRKKLEQQTERLNKSGAAPPKEKKPHCIGRIIIEGNAKIPTDKIRELIELQPGQVLQYPALEASRARLEKYGFLGVTVEVVPGEADSPVKDVRVKVIEPPAATRP